MPGVAECVTGIFHSSDNWLLFVLWRLRQLPENVLRLRAREDCEGDTVRACGVEQLSELSESESSEVARLWRLRDWLSLEFIRARRVTWKAEFSWSSHQHHIKDLQVIDDGETWRF